jgi:hypothetical protein
MLHMLQNQRKASEWSCNDQEDNLPSRSKSTDMTHVTVTFSGTHEFLCRSKLNSFDDHGMCATPCRTVLLKQVRRWQPPPSNLTDTNMAACLFSVGRCESSDASPAVSREDRATEPLAVMFSINNQHHHHRAVQQSGSKPSPLSYPSSKRS